MGEWLPIGNKCCSLEEEEEDEEEEEEASLTIQIQFLTLGEGLKIIDVI